MFTHFDSFVIINSVAASPLKFLHNARTKDRQSSILESVAITYLKCFLENHLKIIVGELIFHYTIYSTVKFKIQYKHISKEHHEVVLDLKRN